MWMEEQSSAKSERTDCNRPATGTVGWLAVL